MRRGGGATQAQGLDIVGCAARRKENPRRRIRKINKKQKQEEKEEEERLEGSLERESICRVATQYLVDGVENPLLCKTRIEQST